MTTSPSPSFDTAAALGAELAAGRLDAVELCEAVLAAIAASDDPAIFVATTPERARREAEASAQRHREGRPLGILDGVPVAWKDLFAIAGMPTTAGSRVLADAPPAAHDAAVVARLAEAGMVTVGRVNMTEFAYSGIGLNPHHGTPRNPCGAGEARIPGGSSSGSAVAVARGLVPVAMGSDTSGSVRIPAALNGVVGYKASGGRYPMDGVHPLAPSLDTLGPLTRTVEDAILVDAALRGVAATPLPPDPQGARIVVPTSVVFDRAEPAVAENFEATLDRLRAAGMRIERCPLPAFEDIFDLFSRHGTLVAAEAYPVLKEFVDGPRAGEVDHRVVARARLGATITQEARQALLTARERLASEAAAALGPGAFVAYPTVPVVAPTIASLEADDELFFATNMLILRNTMLGSFLGWCGVSIPDGADASGLPTGFLLNAPAGADDALLALARRLEPVIRG